MSKQSVREIWVKELEKNVLNICCFMENFLLLLLSNIQITRTLFWPYKVISIVYASIIRIQYKDKMLCLRKKNWMRALGAHTLFMIDSYHFWSSERKGEGNMLRTHTKYSHVWSLCVAHSHNSLNDFLVNFLYCRCYSCVCVCELALGFQSSRAICCLRLHTIIVHLSFHLFKWIIIIFSLLNEREKKRNDWLLWFVQRFFFFFFFFSPFVQIQCTLHEIVYVILTSIFVWLTTIKKAHTARAHTYAKSQLR